MSRRAQRVVGGLLVSSAVSIAMACGLPSTDEFAAGIQPEGDGGGDARTVVDGAEGGPTVRAEAGADAEAGAPVFTCPADAIFCELFEGNFTDQWQLTQNGGTVKSGDGKDGRGLVASVDEHEGPDRLQAYLFHPIKLPAARTPLTVSFDLFYSVTKGMGIVDSDFLQVHGPFYRVGFRLADYSEGFFLHEYGDPYDGGPGLGSTDLPMMHVPAARWTRVALSLTYPGGAAHAKVTYDGQTMYDADIGTAPYVEANPYAIAGISTTEGAGSAIDVKIDNYLVTSP